MQSRMSQREQLSLLHSFYTGKITLTQLILIAIPSLPSLPSFIREMIVLQATKNVKTFMQKEDLNELLKNYLPSAKTTPEEKRDFIFFALTAHGFTLESAQKSEPLLQNFFVFQAIVGELNATNFAVGAKNIYETLGNNISPAAKKYIEAQEMKLNIGFQAWMRLQFRLADQQQQQVPYKIAVTPTRMKFFDDSVAKKNRSLDQNLQVQKTDVSQQHLHTRRNNR